MFHRSYIPSHLAVEDENQEDNHDQQQQEHKPRSSSLDFELYTPRSPNLPHLQHHQLFHYNDCGGSSGGGDNQRRRSTSFAATAVGTSAFNSEVVGEDDKEPVIQWFLLQNRGTISFRLPTEKPILVGSGSECDIRFLHNQSAQQQSPLLSSSSTAPVDKRHAVLAYEPSSNCFTVRDLNTTNGTYVNNRKLCADHPETVSNLDVLRFGYDIHFILEKRKAIAITAKSTDASLSTAGIGGGRFEGGSGSSGPSSLPPTLNNYNRNNKEYGGGGGINLENPLSRSISTEDNHHHQFSSLGSRGLPPKGSNSLFGGGGTVSSKSGGGSPYLPRKSLLTVTKSDPGNREEGNINSGIFSERLAQFQRRSSGSGLHEGSPVAYNLEKDKQCGGDRISVQNTPNNVMQQGGRSGTSGVCSPSLTLDSGRGSSSAPSSPAKEMSPVQMMAAATTGAPGGGCVGGGSSSSQSHNASPVFARKLSRPMEYLLGGQQTPSSGGNGENINGGTSDFMQDPHYSVGLSSGNYTSFCTSGSEPISFATSSSGVGSGMPSATTTNTTTASPNSPGGNGNMNNNLNCGGGFPGSDCCEILQITEDYDEEDIVARKDSLEENEEDEQRGRRSRSDSNQVMLNGDSRNSGGKNGGVQPQFLVGGDIMQPDLNVPNEVFGPVSHAEILNRNNVHHHHQPHNNNVMNNGNLNSQHSSPTGRQGITHNNKPVLVDGYTTASTNHHHAPRARSSSGGEGGGGSNASTPLSALYGTPHWWPDSPPPEENCCPPPPASSTNASPFKKPFMLNNNTYFNNIRPKGNSSSSSLADQAAKDLSLESTHSQQSSSHNITSPSSPAPPPISSSSLEETPNRTETPTTMAAEVKKLTPMAFTIDFGDANEGGGGTSVNEAAEAKKAAIAERLSKFAPRHRRNASLTKSDDVVAGTGNTEPFNSSSLPKQTKNSSNSLGRTQTSQSQHQQRQSSVSNAAAESSSSASKCASLPKKLSTISSIVASGGGASMSKHPSGGSNNDSGLRSLSPETISSTTSSSSRSRPVIDSQNKSNSSARKSASDNNTSSSMGRKSGGSANNKNGSRGGTPATRRTTTPSDGLRSNSYQRETTVVDKPNNKKVTAIPQLNDLSKGSTTVTPTVVLPPSPPKEKVDKEDTVSEAGTYTVEKETPDVLNARDNIEEIFGLNGDDEMDKENNLANVALTTGNETNKSFGGVEPGTRDWVREWAELAAQQHQQKKRERPELPDSQYFLRETETLVSAIQERVSKHMKSGGSASLGGAPVSDDDDSDEDEPTLSHHTPVKSQSQHSTPTNTNNKRRPPSRTSPFHRESSVLSDSGYAIGYQSDSSNEGSSSRNGIVTNKMNRAFNIRRGGRRNFGYDSTEPLLMMNNQQSISNSTTTIPLNNTRGISPRPPKHNQVNSLSKCSNVSANNSSSSNFARNDGGRFSLRMAKSRTPPAQLPPQTPRQNSYSVGSGEPNQGRVMMNGHKSSESREQSVGSSAGGGGGKKITPTGKVINNVGPGSNKKSSAGNRSNSTLTAKEVELANWKRRKNYDPMKAAAEGKKTKKNGASSGAESGVEENATLPPIASPKVNRREAMMTKSLSFHQESYSPKCASEDEDMIYIVDEMDSSHSNSPNHLSGGGSMTRSYHEDVMYYGMSSSAAMRPKNKVEVNALDNLVIATIHSLSNKVRTSSRHLLEKLQVQHASDENGALLEEMVSQLKELEGPSSTTSPNKSPSRELSGTLKNLKKLEQVVLVLDKVLCDGFESDVNG